MFVLPYTICFCLCGNQMLMLYRNNPPNANRWNGLGGKIEAGETSWDNIHREMLEEADIDLNQAQELRFTGLVTWVALNVSSIRGMYVFVARLAPDFPLTPDRSTPEGLLSWKAQDWVCDQSNLAVVDNIPLFLPPMLAEQEPQEYRCAYQEGKLLVVTASPLPADVLGL